ncbi:MAG: ribulose-phosphate 3-epimerase, partial [Acidobacteria bacterium]|nr:ribulose-phosphate 3-epimerase [Acidobacteriota bacterium]
RGLGFRIEIDGGVTLDNVAEIARAGCDIIVAGTAVFGSPYPGEAVTALSRAAAGAAAVRV